MCATWCAGCWPAMGFRLLTLPAGRSTPGGAGSWRWWPSSWNCPTRRWHRRTRCFGTSATVHRRPCCWCSSGCWPTDRSPPGTRWWRWRSAPASPSTWCCSGPPATDRCLAAPDRPPPAGGRLPASPAEHADRGGDAEGGRHQYQVDDQEACWTGGEGPRVGPDVAQEGGPDDPAPAGYSE